MKCLVSHTFNHRKDDQHKVQKETAHINKPVNPPESEGSQPAAPTGGATAQADLLDQTVNQTVNQTANLSILSDIDNNTICEWLFYQ